MTTLASAQIVPSRLMNSVNPAHGLQPSLVWKQFEYRFLGLVRNKILQQERRCASVFSYATSWIALGKDSHWLSTKIIQSDTRPWQ